MFRQLCSASKKWRQHPEASFGSPYQPVFVVKAAEHWFGRARSVRRKAMAVRRLTLFRWVFRDSRSQAGMRVPDCRERSTPCREPGFSAGGIARWSECVQSEHGEGIRVGVIDTGVGAAINPG